MVTRATGYDGTEKHPADSHDQSIGLESMSSHTKVPSVPAARKASEYAQGCSGRHTNTLVLNFIGINVFRALVISDGSATSTPPMYEGQKRDHLDR